MLCGLFLAIASICFSIITPTAQAATLGTLNFQARLQTNPGGAIVPDGYYNVEFKLYNASSSSGSSQGSCTGDAACLWTETWYDSNGVTAGNDNRIRVSHGYLTANLGSLTSFPGTINWDQNLYITMNIGGSTQTATPTWNGEMSPRLALTAVPYAFRAGQLAKFGGTYTSTLSLTSPTVGNQSFVLPDMAAAGTYTLLNDMSGIKLQSTTPGSQQTGNFNISGTGIAGTFLTSSLDQSSAGILSIGTSTTATGITVGNTTTTGTLTLGQSTGSNTISIGSANTATGNTQTINIGAGTPAGTGKAVLVLGNTSNASSVSLNAGSGNITLNTNSSSGGTVVKSVTSNSVTAFQVQNASGTSVFTVDTSGGSGTGRAGVGLASDPPLAKLHLHETAASTSTTLFLTNAATTATTANGLYIQLGSTGNGVINMLKAGANLGLGAGSSGLNSFTIFGDGSSLSKNITDSSTAFRIQNLNGTNLFNIGTSAPAANLVTNPGFEVNTTGWSNKGTGALTRITTPTTALYDGSNAGSLAMTAANDGASFAATLTLGATYNFSFYARNSSGTASNISFGYTNTGGDNDCVTNTTVVSGGFTRYSCSFTVSATAGTAVYVKQSSIATQTLYVDGFQLLSSATSATPYSLGTTQLRGLIDAPVALQNTNNSTTAFQIQNSAGTSNLFVADTLNNQLLIGGSIVQSGSGTFTSGSGAIALNGSSITLGDATTDRVTFTAQVLGASPIVFQGATDNAFTTTLALTDPTANNTITLPNASGTVAVSATGNIALSAAGQISLTGQVPVSNGGTGASTFTANGVLYGNGTSAVGVTAAGTTGQCLVSTTSAAPSWGACGTSSTMQDTYNASSTTNPQIQLSTANGGLKLRDAATPVSGNMFQVQNSAGTATYFGLSTTVLTMQDSSGNNALVFDSSGDSHLKLYANSTTPTLYADIYYDTTNSQAVFAASSGTTAIGNGTGSINLQVTGAADVINGTKTNTLAGAYSLSDFNFTQTLTGGSNSISGAVMNITSNSTTSGTNSQNTLQITQTNNTTGNVLQINQQNGSGGNLIRALTGGSTEKFKVTNAGTVSIAAGQSYTGAGAVTLSSGAATALTITGNAASTFSTSSGALTLTSAAAATWSTSAGALTLTSAAAATWGTSVGMLTVSGAAGVTITGGTANVQIGSSTTDATATLTILDSYNNATDPTGVNGAMYYNTATSRFRCYQASTWYDCLGISPDYQRKRPFYSTDFLDSGNVAAGFWQSNKLGGGTTATDGTLETPASGVNTANNPGIVSPTSSSTATSGSGWRFGASSAQLIAGGENFEVIFSPATITNVQTRFGFVDTGSNDSISPTDGAWIDLANGTVSGKTASSGSITTTGTNQAVSIGTWYRCRVVVNSNASQVDFYLYNASTGAQIWTDSVTATIPTAAGRMTGSGVTSWTTSATALKELVRLDYMAQWWDKDLVR